MSKPRKSFVKCAASRCQLGGDEGRTARSQEFPDTTCIEGVRQHFSGQVIIGRDEMVL